jgi:hypothetical protein
VLVHVSTLLDECDDAMNSTGGAAVESVRANVDEATELAKKLPGKVEIGDADIGALRGAAMARIAKLRTWLADQKHSAPLVGVDASAPASSDVTWWLALKQAERDRIRHTFEEIKKFWKEKDAREANRHPGSGSAGPSNQGNGPPPDGNRQGSSQP